MLVCCYDCGDVVLLRDSGAILREREANIVNPEGVTDETAYEVRHLCHPFGVHLLLSCFQCQFRHMMAFFSVGSIF